MAELQFIIAASQGVKINGRKVTIADFLPPYMKPKRQYSGVEELMKEASAALAKQAANGQG